MKNRMLAVIMLLALSSSLLVSCGETDENTQNPQHSESSEISEVFEPSESEEPKRYPHEYTKEPEMTEINNQRQNLINDNYRTWYEVYVYSFYDSNEDRVGDIPGLISKLNYIGDGDPSTDTDLGCNGIRLMPVMPSPSEHKYDVADYMDIDPIYGTIGDFETLIDECHNRDIHIIMDFVINYTSSQHNWFQEAGSYLKTLPAGEEPSVEECPFVEYYHFSTEKLAGYCELEGTKWYYEARFGNDKPDLNLESESLREEFDAIVQFWLDKGVDGFCLNAVGEYAADSSEAGIEILTWFTNMVKEKKKDIYLVGEAAGEYTEYAAYYESGISSMLDFSFAGKNGAIAETLNGNGENNAAMFGNAITDAQKEIEKYTKKYINASFYVNHDMERSVEYYDGNFDEDKIKMAHAMNLLMTGSSFLYYGEELGMPGAGTAENSRMGMLWSTSKNADGICDGPQGAEEQGNLIFGSIREQRTDLYSIYNYVKQAIKIRNIYPQISRGKTTFKENLSTENICVLSKLHEGTEILLLFNVTSEESAISLKGYKVNGSGWGNYEIIGMLQTGEDAPRMEDSTLILPPYSIILFK